MRISNRRGIRYGTVNEIVEVDIVDTLTDVRDPGRLVLHGGGDKVNDFSGPVTRFILNNKLEVHAMVVTGLTSNRVVLWRL